MLSEDLWEANTKLQCGRMSNHGAGMQLHFGLVKAFFGNLPSLEGKENRNRLRNSSLALVAI